MRSLFATATATAIAVALPCGLLAACTQDGRGSSATPAGSGSASGSGAGASTPSSALVPDAVRIAVCKAEPCGGDASSIRVYRDAGGTVKKLYRLYGTCSHSPGIYFDPDGTKTETIPEKPIVPESDEARAFKAKHEAQVGTLKHTDTISCSDGSLSPP